MTLFEAVKQIDCNDAAAKLGLQGGKRFGKKGMWCCPFHDDHHPSMACFGQGKGFYCYTCHKWGDAADLYARVRGLPIRQAAMTALEEAGLPIPEGTPPPPKPQKTPAQLRQENLAQAEKALQRAWLDLRALFAEGLASGMVHVLEQNADPDSWLWRYAMQKAYKVQDECNRLRALDASDAPEEIAEQRKFENIKGIELPVPDEKYLLDILEDLLRTDPALPRLTEEDKAEVVSRLMAKAA